jgi:hypothetical protein
MEANLGCARLNAADMGHVCREADLERTALETVLQDLLDGQYKNPIRVISFGTAEGWSQDVSADVAEDRAAAVRPSHRADAPSA